jgi:hypothetical protein
MAVSAEDLLPTPAGYANPAQIAEARQFAMRMAPTGDEEIQHPLQGYGQMIRALMSGLLEQEANQQENLGRRSAGIEEGNALMNKAPGSGDDSVPSGGNPSLPEVPISGNAFRFGSGPVDADAAKYAISENESGGRYDEVGPMILHGHYAGDRAIGKYQVMASDLPQKLRDAGLPSMTPAQFKANHQAQELQFEHEFINGYMRKFGNFNDAASMWFSGRPFKQAGNASDGYMSVPVYIAKANRSLAKYQAANAQPIGLTSSFNGTPTEAMMAPWPSTMSDAGPIGGPGSQLAQASAHPGQADRVIAAPPAPGTPAPPPGAVPVPQPRPAVMAQGPTPPVAPPGAVNPVAARFGTMAPITAPLPPGFTGAPGAITAPPGSPSPTPTAGPGALPFSGGYRPAPSPPPGYAGPRPQPQPVGPRPPMDNAQIYPNMSSDQVMRVMAHPWVPQKFKDELSARLQPRVVEGPNGDKWQYAPGRAPVLLAPGLGDKSMVEFPGGLHLPSYTRIGPGGDATTSVPYLEQQGGSGLAGAMNLTNRIIEAQARAKAVGEEGGKATMQPIQEQLKESKTAAMALDNLNLIEDTVRNHGKGIVTGPLAEPWLQAREALKGTFNIDIGDPRGLQASEIIKKLNAQLASAELPAFTARGTQFDLKTFMANNPGLSTSAQGTLFLTNILKQAHRQQLELSGLAADPNNWNNWAEVRKNFYETHPLINPLTGHKLGVYADTSQQGEPQPSAPSINTEIGPKRFKYDAQGNRLQ